MVFFANFIGWILIQKAKFGYNQKSNFMNLTKQTIPLTDAKDWAAKWQSENPNKAKAFLIPIEDLIETLKEMNVLQEVPGQGTFTINNIPDAGVRAYMAIDDNVPPSVGSNEKLLLVGTAMDSQGTHCDIVEDGHYPTGGIQRVGTGIFDFTKPCPNYCDMGSPLFNPAK